MKMMGKVGMFIAVSLLMLHSFMPHQHLNQISEERHILEHAQADSLLDYIRLAFHLNPGENHLEEFEQSSPNSVYFPVAELSAFKIEFIQVAYEDNGKIVELASTLEHQFISLSLSFRGPPQLS